MLRLGEHEPESCACGRANPPSAGWCSACGRELGAEPSFADGHDWQLGSAEFIDIGASDLNGETPRLWRSGGAGAWYVTENPSGMALAHVLNSGGLRDQASPAGLGPFADIRAVEATRRGLYAVFADRLAIVLRPLHDPWQWAAEPLVEMQERPVIGIAPAPSGQIYRLTRSDDRIQLSAGSGIGAWRELASASALGMRESWLEVAVSPAGDILFWGGGLAGTFEQRRRRLTTKSLTRIADIPFSLKYRMARLPLGDWRAWSPTRPVLVPLEDAATGILSWAAGDLVLRPLPETVPELQVAVSLDGAVVGRSKNQIVRIYAGNGAVATAAAGAAEEALEVASAPWRDGAVFIVSAGDGTRAEFVCSERVAAARDVVVLTREDSMPSGAGFEPLPICNYTAQSGPLHRIWIALDHGAGHRAGAIQRIMRFGTARG